MSGDWPVDGDEGLVADGGGLGGIAHPGTEMTVSHISAAMMAGGTATMMTNPLWVVKTRFMVSDSCCLRLSRERNLETGLDDGAVPSLLFTLYHQTFA